jgi:hypothetical protein
MKKFDKLMIFNIYLLFNNYFLLKFDKFLLILCMNIKKEEKMKELKKEKKSPIAWVSIILLFAFWIGFAIGTFNLFKGMGAEINKVFFLKSESFKASMLDVYIELFLQKVILFWVLLHLQWIMLTVIRGAAFDSRNPGRIRKVAFGAFAFAIINLAADFYWSGLPALKFSSLYMLVKSEVFRMALFGVGILIIGKAFENGLILRKEQELTV